MRQTKEARQAGAVCCWAKQHDSRGSPTGTQHLLLHAERFTFITSFKASFLNNFRVEQKKSPLSRVKLWGHHNFDHHSSDARRPYRPCHRLGITPRVSGHSLAARRGVSGDLGLRNHRMAIYAQGLDAGSLKSLIWVI